VNTLHGVIVALRDKKGRARRAEEAQQKKNQKKIQKKKQKAKQADD